MTAWTCATYNAGDVGTPPTAHVVAIQERPPARDIAKALPLHDVLYPGPSALAFAYDGKRVEVLGWKLRKIHGGRAKVTPARFVLEVRCKVDGQRVAFLNSHLVNNSFGPVVRGERAYRLDLWMRGWAVITARRVALAGRYKVFALGDFNRKAPYWRDAKRVVGEGYDRIFYPRGVQLVESWHGERAGSDHRPLVAKFKFSA